MTINEVTTRSGGAVASFSDDPYLDYGIEAATAGQFGWVVVYHDIVGNALQTVSQVRPLR